MMAESFLNHRVILHSGDCMDVLVQFDPDSIDSCVTDPPYHLTSIVRRFGGSNAAPVKAQFGTFKRHSAGFMGQNWDGGDVAFRPETWAKVYRVLKPGAHLLAFGGTRTYHRMACAIEDAGFEIRDCIQWLYGSGFPKSHDVSKGIDRAAGAEREVIGKSTTWMQRTAHHEQSHGGFDCTTGGLADVTAPATDSARQWQGWGTALKPACEPIVLARKPLSEKTVAANVLRWGTGALNIDGCRVGTETVSTHSRGSNGAFPKRPTERSAEESGRTADQRAGLDHSERTGRWPANVIHDGSDEVVGAFPAQAGSNSGKPQAADGKITNKWMGNARIESYALVDDSRGSAARFFYTAKADSDDRIGSKHPTTKPLDLIQYLVRLITPKGGTCLDPFAGTGTTGEAAWREGMRAILIEREAEYQADIRRRMALCLSGPDERCRESIKAKLKDKPIDPGPLFGGCNDRSR
jgi:DNA modification methylase